MLTTRNEKMGKSTWRWQRNQDGSYSGTVISAAKRSEVLHDDDEDRLRTRLRNLAGTLEPNYFGMDEAIARYLRFMPGGFMAERNLSHERRYKVQASEELNALLTPEQALEATNEDAVRIRQAGKIWINLLSPYESLHLKAAMESPNGGRFLQGAAQFALGDIVAGAAVMARAMQDHGRLSWPTATYFPYLWEPTRHMFLKPMVTCDFAERVGHRFQYDYRSEIDSDVYESLIDLADFTAASVVGLKPQDRIDVQSFIYVVGDYKDDDLPE